MLDFNLVPAILNNSFQKLLMNSQSLSDTVELGNPCNLTISAINKSATSLAEKGWHRGIK